MKMVVAYIDREAFEPIRAELLGLGFLSLSVWDASGSIAQATTTGQYRGVAVENHLRPKARCECVVSDGQVATVIETVSKHAGDRRFVFVVAIEQADPTDTIRADDALQASE